MPLAELKPNMWIPALIRRAEISGAFAMVLKKGDPDGGAALITVRDGDGLVTLYRPVRNLDGLRVWWPKSPAEEAEVNAYVRSRIEDDPDIWVIEIEDKAGRHFLLDPIEET